MENRAYNPDVLNCIANLSNDEVFTPPSLANQVLDTLPQELFCSPDTTFLDPFCKSGVFLREIVKRLDKGLKEKIPDRRQRIDHIMHRQVFGIALTELTTLLSRRTLYCSKNANGPHSVSRFANEQGNVRYDAVRHTWQNGKCRYCGASKEVYDRGDASEQYAYQFIHTDNPEKLFPKNMTFDVIIGNPPYQMSDGGGNGASAIPLFHKFVEQAKKLNPRYLTMIIPARWYSGGKGLDEFRETMLNDMHIRHITDYADSRECFSNVDIAGGICYFLWDRENQGNCMFRSIKGGTVKEFERKLNEYQTFIRDYEALRIIKKIQAHHENCFNEIVYSRNPYGFSSTAKVFKKKEETFITIMTSKGDFYVPHKDVKSNKETIERWKVVMSKASAEHAGQVDKDGRRKIVSRTEILPPNKICSESYLLIDVFQTKREAENLLSYIKTRFFRYLLSTILLTQNISKDKFQFVPLQDFSHPWSDEMLYKKYGLDEKEIAFIESMIRPME